MDHTVGAGLGRGGPLRMRRFSFRASLRASDNLALQLSWSATRHNLAPRDGFGWSALNAMRASYLLESWAWIEAANPTGNSPPASHAHSDPTI